MELSVAGLILALALLLIGRLAGAALLVGLCLAIPFQSTAFVSLPALGGSSAPVATLFASLFILSTLLRTRFAGNVRAVFAGRWAPWVLVGLTIYVAGGAYFLPRIFEGRTSAFVPMDGAIFEVPLGPVGGNITQACYFILGTLTFIAIGVTLQEQTAWRKVRDGLFALVVAHALAGIINLVGNLGSLGDVLTPIRTASYAMLADQQEGGLWRIAGASPETSGFSALALACLAFTSTYWRRTGSATAFILSLVELALLLLSTSTTAYVGLAVMTAALAVSVSANILRGRMPRRDLQVLALGSIGLVVALVAAMLLPAVLDQFGELVDSMVFKKHLSSSGQERGYWNSQSLKAFLDTSGLGVGIGSSRASSWVVAVLSQTGVVGALAFAALIAATWWTVERTGTKATSTDARLIGDLAVSARAMVLASLLGGAISGGAVDPGLLVFVGMAICLSVGPAHRGTKTRTGTARWSSAVVPAV